jgi:dipeptidyl aminopeptidase/acylaminoacyl peptidase
MIEDEEEINLQSTATSPSEIDPAATMQIPAHTASPSIEPDTTQPAEPENPEQETSSAPTTNPPQKMDSVPLPELASHTNDTPAPDVNILSMSPAMESDDLLLLRIVSDPQISPDGTTVVYTLQQSDQEQNTTGSAIWLVHSTDRKVNPPRQLTNGAYHDSMPRWSPDGHAIAFLSDRTGTYQLYLLTMNGGEAHQISFLAHDITEYCWRPDSQMLLAHSAWKPEGNQNSSYVDTLEKNARSSTVYTRLDERKDGKEDRQGYTQQLWLIALQGAALRLTSEPVDLIQSCWSPDGNEIAFCANRRSYADLSTTTALWVLNIHTGQMRRLTPEEGMAYMPSWSPDGQSIAYLSTLDETRAGNISPWIVSASGNSTSQPFIPQADQLTCQVWIIDELRSEWLTRPIWYPNSTAVLVPVQEHGQVHLYYLDKMQQTKRQLTSTGRYLSPHLDTRGQTITMIRADWFTPGDVWCMDSDGKNQRKLTRINDAILQSHQLIRPRRISWESFDGTQIEGWFYLPPQTAQKKIPLIVAPHGGPYLSWGDSYVHEFQVLAGKGYAILAPNLRGSAGYGEEFSRKLINDWGGSDLQDLFAGIDHLITTEAIDEHRLGITGMSYGGYLTNFAISQSNRFKAAVSRNGISSLETVSRLSDHNIWYNASMPDEKQRHERSPLTFADQITAPLLLLHAENDQDCPFSEALQLFTILRNRKQKVELVRYHNTSHLMDWPGIGTPQQRVDRLHRTVAWFQTLL